MGKTLSDSGSELQSDLLHYKRGRDKKKWTLRKSIEGTGLLPQCDQGKAVPGSVALCPAIKSTS